MFAAGLDDALALELSERSGDGFTHDRVASLAAVATAGDDEDFCDAARLPLAEPRIRSSCSLRGSGQ